VVTIGCMGATPTWLLKSTICLTPAVEGLFQFIRGQGPSNFGVINGPGVTKDLSASPSPKSIAPVTRRAQLSA
jgi:hypothetical protein